MSHHIVRVTVPIEPGLERVVDAVCDALSDVDLESSDVRVFDRDDVAADGRRVELTGSADLFPVGMATYVAHAVWREAQAYVPVRVRIQPAGGGLATHIECLREMYDRWRTDVVKGLIDGTAPGPSSVQVRLNLSFVEVDSDAPASLTTADVDRIVRNVQHMMGTGALTAGLDDVCVDEWSVTPHTPDAAE